MHIQVQLSPHLTQFRPRWGCVSAKRNNDHFDELDDELLHRWSPCRGRNEWVLVLVESPQSGKKPFVFVVAHMVRGSGCQ